MQTGEDWNGSHRSFVLGSTLRLTLIVSAVAVVLGLVVAPLAEGGLRGKAGVERLDFISTGSIDINRSYTIRRSVLQSRPDSVCIIRDNGARSGDCG
ncbi:hypothetical protein EJC49_11920 [Aquibium carbonis]|uniref:Uncharacterized protein n=1 Tax=Aquibium carbonis TaxID=2495581 RepID=A0A3R9Y7X9_9HYPH|nr:hypothetical protein [Aquibium carbonis]RST86130.1 hypothetical protein EJC49_11920 [Aquibium carbonis]